MFVVERLNEAAQVARLDLAAEEDVGADVEIVGKRQILIDRLNACAARVHRGRETNRSAVEDNLPVVRRVDAGNAFDERRLSRPVVAEQTHHLAARDVEAHVVHGDESAEDFCQVADGQQGVGHCAAPPRVRPMMRSRDWSISTATITTVPTTMNCQKASTLSITSPVVSTAMMRAPITVPITVPAPPNMLTPPIMTAAIELRSSGSPMTADPAVKRKVDRKPATPEVAADRM